MIDIILCVYPDGLRPNYDGEVKKTSRSENDGLEGGDKKPSQGFLMLRLDALCITGSLSPLWQGLRCRIAWQEVACGRLAATRISGRDLTPRSQVGSGYPR